jgi:hypothetical protein
MGSPTSETALDKLAGFLDRRGSVWGTLERFGVWDWLLSIFLFLLPKEERYGS